MSAKHCSEATSLFVFIQGKSNTIISSISFVKGVIKFPIDEVSKVILQLNVSFTARKAGEDIITSPILSARMHKIFLHVFQLSITQNHFLVCKNCCCNIVPVDRKS